jgi:hypothetical protein
MIRFGHLLNHRGARLKPVARREGIVDFSIKPQTQSSLLSGFAQVIPGTFVRVSYDHCPLSWGSRSEFGMVSFHVKDNSTALGIGAARNDERHANAQRQQRQLARGRPEHVEDSKPDLRYALLRQVTVDGSD